MSFSLNGHNVEFLIDTGADLSTINLDVLRESGLSYLHSTNGKVELDLRVDDQHVLRYEFCVQRMGCHNLLGMNFLYDFDVRVDFSLGVLDISLTREIAEHSGDKSLYIEAEFFGGTHRALVDSGFSGEMKVVPDLVDPENKEKHKHYSTSVLSYTSQGRKLRRIDYLKDVEVSIPSLHRIWKPRKVQVSEKVFSWSSPVLIGLPFLRDHKITFSARTGSVETPSMPRPRKSPKRCGRSRYCCTIL